MTRIVVLDPTAPPAQADADPGPDTGHLQGKTVGIRYDRTWRSFEWVIDEWQRLLAADSAQVRTWCAGSRIGGQGERTRTELEAFADAVDIAILGLGN